MKPLSDKDVEYHREYSKQYYIKKQLGELSHAPRQQAGRKKLPYYDHCKNRSLYDLLPIEGGIVQRVCQACGQGDLYVGPEGLKQTTASPTMTREEAIQWLRAIVDTCGEEHIPPDAIPPDVLEALQYYGFVEPINN